jgi:hypothetical protein
MITPTIPDAPRPPLVSESSSAADGTAAADVLDPQVIAALQVGGISLVETLGIALKSLTANKLRTLLTALGIIIGVAAAVCAVRRLAAAASMRSRPMRRSIPATLAAR